MKELENRRFRSVWRERGRFLQNDAKTEQKGQFDSKTIELCGKVGARQGGGKRFATAFQGTKKAPLLAGLFPFGFGVRLEVESGLLWLRFVGVLGGLAWAL